MLFFAQDGLPFKRILVFVSMLMPITIVATYFINYFLIPTYLLRDKHFVFLLYFIYTLIAAVFLESVITLAAYLLVANRNIREISPAAIDVRYALSALLMIIFLGVSIKLLSHWRNSRHQYDLLLKDKTEAELRFLKTQLSPHFLFNTLNNIYYLTAQKSDLAPKAILALSELLNYILNETRALFVPISIEIDLIKNFVELEKLRFGDRISVQIETNEINESKTNVAPMLLLTLVENAFKHGVGRSNGQHFIHISIKSESNLVVVRVENSISGQGHAEAKGIGLRNLRSQLELLYPNRHELSTLFLSDRFVASLNLST